MESLEMQFTFSAHFKERCFEVDVSQRLVGKDPQKHRRPRILKHGAAVQTLLVTDHSRQNRGLW